MAVRARPTPPMSRWTADSSILEVESSIAGLSHPTDREMRLFLSCHFSSRSTLRRGDTFDKEPHREHDLEEKRRHPLVISSHRPRGKAGYLEWQRHAEQDRREQAQPRHPNGHKPSAKQKVGEYSTPHGKE